MLKKLKNFCRLTRRSEGFTLVELVVVIAIVAILSGIAVPAYGAYVEKSQKAGDLQLLAAVNKAFAAAAFENQDPIEDIDYARLLPSNKGSAPAMTRAAINTDDSYAIVGIDKVVVNGVDKTSGYDEAFKKYYADNTTAKFKAIDFINLQFANGIFSENPVDPGDVKDAVDNFNKSNLSASGAATLAGSVEELSDILAGRLDPNEDGIGMLASWMGEDYQDFLKDYKISEENYNPSQVANAAVMYAASKMKDVTSADIIKLTNGNISQTDKLVAEYGAIPTAALMYGVITGYANSEHASDSFKQTYATPPTGITEVMNMVNTMKKDPNFQTYYKAEEKGAMADVDGYLSAMKVINAYDGNFDLSNSELFTDDSTMELLNSILNKK